MARVRLARGSPTSGSVSPTAPRRIVCFTILQCSGSGSAATTHWYPTTHRHSLVRRLPPDNAQNWFRHQLAELGLLGSLGWIIWVAGFVHLIAAGQYKPDREVQAGMLRWLLLALGAASFVGVPTLNATAAFSFWVLAVWFVLQLEPRALRPVWVPRASSWVLALVLAGVYAVGLAQVSRVELRVPHRARLGEWDLQHGFHDPEPSAAHGEYRWSLKNAVTVMHADTHRLRLTLWVNHPDAA